MIRFALILTVTLVCLVGVGRFGAQRWVAATDLPTTALSHSVEVRDREGKLMRAYQVTDGRWRLGARPDQVDPRFLRMLIAYEDRRFARHAGVDPLAMLRAVGQSLRYGRFVSGGSTLTMQVARLLEESGTGKWQGKLRQIRVALALEARLSKDEILSLYLSLAPYGGNLEGVRAATLAWFGKEPGRLTPAQAALLVALPQSPEARRPDHDAGAARAARSRVLERMVRAGVLAPEDATAAASEPVPTQRRAFPMLAPHLADRLVTQDPLIQRHDLTLDMRLQAAAQDLARAAVAGKQDKLSIAILIADHQTGDILASVGSPDYAPGHRQGFVDMTQALRSPGSTLKPLVYALAFDQGLVHPETLIEDRPISFAGYAPQNFDGQFRGDIRVAEALRQSLNIPVVMLTDQIGPPCLMAALTRAGASPVVPGGKPGLAVALGGLGMTLQDLVQLYAGLAQEGRSVPLRSHGAGAPSEQIVSRSAAWQVAHILSGLAPPTGAPQNRLAYKTGTSYGHRDAWAVGFDGRHVAGVWMGRPDGTPVPGAFGGDLAAPVLFQAFERLKPALAPLAPPPPETLLLSNADLPQPLRRFRGRNAPFEPAADAPKLTFPPDGARLALSGEALTVKLRDGVAPFSILANGAAVVTRQRQREIALPVLPSGFVTLSVIDAKGRAARAQIQID